jgi:HD-like signal output (HDOD) protein
VGLLSELGRLVLASCLTSTYKTVLNEAPWPSTQLERERIGFSNTDVTAALLTSWNLPNEIVLPIAHRDQPEQLPSDSAPDVIRLCRILAAASILANEWSAGDEARGMSWAGDAASHYLKMTPDTFAGVVENLRARVEDMSLFVDASPPGQVDSRRMATEASERLKESLARSRSESRLTQLLRAAEV